MQNSVPQLINLFFFLILFFFLFGIFGVQFFKGVYWRCDYDHVDSGLKLGILTMQDCMDAGGDWLRMDSNFDDIWEAVLTMFKVAITEGWIDIMYRGIDN